MDGRLSRLTSFAQRADSIWETDAYDLASRFVRRVQKAGADTLHSDSLHYDRAGKVTANVGSGDSVAFSSLGALRHAEYANESGAEQVADDALGNHTSMCVPAASYKQRVYSYLPGSDRMSLAVQPAECASTPKFPHVLNRQIPARG